MKKILILLLLCAPSSYALEFASGVQATSVMELYTSEGCSSCPPADHFLSSLNSQPEIFTELIPMAFHVDYWDGLGWKDRFAQPTFSSRQYQLAQAGMLSQVYTPAFVLNNKEWRKGLGISKSTAQPGVLKVKVVNQDLQVDFATKESLQLNIAYLGMGLRTDVKAGENNKKVLQHDFVVLKYWQQLGQNSWQSTLPPVPDFKQQQTVLVVWLTPKKAFNIIQAAAHVL